MCHDSSSQDALLESMHVQSDASARGFDWPSVAGVLAKVDEEIEEIREALVAGEDVHARRELGDLLLVVVNLARFLKADPREELQNATRRFANRFQCLQQHLDSEGRSIRDCSAGELEAYWQRIKPGADELLSRRA